MNLYLQIISRLVIPFKYIDVWQGNGIIPNTKLYKRSGWAIRAKGLRWKERQKSPKLCGCHYPSRQFYV